MDAMVAHSNEDIGTRRVKCIDPAVEHIIEAYTACGDHDNEVYAGGEQDAVELALAARKHHDTTITLYARCDIKSHLVIEGEHHDTALQNDVFHSARPLTKSVPQSKIARFEKEG